MDQRFPHAPMPPHGGGFDNTPMGPPLDHFPTNDFHGPHNDNFHQQQHHGNGQDQSYGDVGNNGGKSKKNKKNKSQNMGQNMDMNLNMNNNMTMNMNMNPRNQIFVETSYVGYECRKAEPNLGEKASWAKFSRHEMESKQKDLEKIITDHRLRTGQSQHKDYEQLPSEFRSVVDALIKRNEDDESRYGDWNAEWRLAYVKRVYKSGWGNKEVAKLRVILKRQDRNLVKPLRRDSKSRRDSQFKTAEYGELIEVNQTRDDFYQPQDDFRQPQDDFVRPQQTRKGSKKQKKIQQTRISDPNVDFQNDRGGLGIQDFNQHIPPPPPHQHNDFQPRLPMPDQFSGPMGFQPQQQFQPPPPGPMPMPMQHDPHGFQQGPPPPLDRRQSVIEPPYGHPFEPHPQFAVPGALEAPDMHDDGLPYVPTAPRPRTRSKSMKRRDSVQRPSTNNRRFSQMDDLNDRVKDWHMSSGSSDEGYREDSIFSRSRPDDRDFSPPSSPISRYSRDSRERTKSYNRPHYRSSRYRDRGDMELVPARTYQGDYRHSDSRRGSARPKLHHAATYDDYPVGRGGDSHFSSGRSRRGTDFDDRYDFQDMDEERRRDGRDGRDGRDMRGSRRQSSMHYDGFDDDFPGGPRDFDGDRRRQRSIGGGGGGGGSRGGSRSYSYHD